MNARPSDLHSQAQQLSETVIQPILGSKKVYIEGSRADIRVPMREIALANTPKMFGTELNAPFSVYDTSGPYTDPDAAIDLGAGLAALRARWIEERGDSEVLGALSSEFGRGRESDARLDPVRFAHLRHPRRARAGQNRPGRRASGGHRSRPAGGRPGAGRRGARSAWTARPRARSAPDRPSRTFGGAPVPASAAGKRAPDEP